MVSFIIAILREDNETKLCISSIRWWRVSYNAQCYAIERCVVLKARSRKLRSGICEKQQEAEGRPEVSDCKMKWTTLEDLELATEISTRTCSIYHLSQWR